MSNAKHTPAPWFIEENADHYPFVMADDNNTVAMLFEKDGSLLYGRTHKETTANAKLIASAPELLEALSSFMELTSKMDYNYCREAIAKAEQVIKKATE